jgi:signal peptide peptidase SppA
MRFPGDVRASQVKELREEVTAVVRAAKPGDEALLVLESGGGTVTGYGLAAGQLMRFKENGIKLTVCVEQVAASGGYMMCCVADKIVASPMAVLGSIGVISDIPNVYERLKKEGIEFQTVTAGKYKRTLTPTKKVTKTDFEKTKADIENVYDLFKDFVKQNRPSLQIEEVATGETWFGSDALEKGLCDEIKTADTVLTEFVDQGYNVYEIKYTEPPTEKVGQLFGVGGSSAVEESNSGLIGRAIRWLARTVVNEIKAEFQGSTSTRVPVESRYMMKDDTADRIFMD